MALTTLYNDMAPNVSHVNDCIEASVFSQHGTILMIAPILLIYGFGFAL